MGTSRQMDRAEASPEESLEHIVVVVGAGTSRWQTEALKQQASSRQMDPAEASPRLMGREPRVGRTVEWTPFPFSSVHDKSCYTRRGKIIGNILLHVN